MGARKLTQLRVDSAKAGTDQNGTHKRTEIPDAVCRGLYLIVQPSGVKSWAVRYRCASDGKPCKLTLDRTDDGWAWPQPVWRPPR
jgi:hypothetical protein